MKPGTFLGMTLCLALAAGALAQEQKKGAAPKMDDAQMKAMMEAWTKYATPGEPQKMLASLDGTWSSRVVDMSAPGTAQESEGTAEFSMVLGGRYQEQRHHGTMMGQPFEGIGYMAYDNAMKKYYSVWMDTAGTGIMSEEGTADASGKVITMAGKVTDPMSGSMAPVRSVMTLKDNDHMLYEMWAPGPGGAEAKVMEIRYTRKR